jgi:hypothetical protein
MRLIHNWKLYRGTVQFLKYSEFSRTNDRLTTGLHLQRVTSSDKRIFSQYAKGKRREISSEEFPADAL